VNDEDDDADGDGEDWDELKPKRGKGVIFTTKQQLAAMVVGAEGGEVVRASKRERTERRDEASSSSPLLREVPERGRARDSPQMRNS
jgi:hypothetical protein